MHVLSPTFFKNSNTVDNRLQHNFQSYAWKLHAPTLIFFSWAPDIINTEKNFHQRASRAGITILCQGTFAVL